MRRFTLALVALSAVLVPLAAGCEPATVDVGMGDSFFSPATMTIARGATVRWTNNGSLDHSTTGDGPLYLWDSGDFGEGGTYSTAFVASGTYGYFCDIHLGMTGTVKVPVKVSPTSGAPGTSFTITVASVPAPAGFDYVVQKMDPGGRFQALATITKASTTFSPTAAGTYKFRSALKRVATGGSSDFSDPMSITVS